MKHSKILIVDDDSNIRSLMCLCLELDGYVVDQAANGADALEHIHSESPDAVILDLAMPGMDGMTLLAELRTMPPQYATRVIVVTAHGSVRTAIDAVRLGASDFLEKPFSPEDLRQSVASVLREAPLNLADTDGGYAQTLQRVRGALRAGEFAIAERTLMKAGTITGEDPAFLNLAGIMHECHGRVGCARRFYERATARDSFYRPAQENIRRLDELERFAKTDRQVAFGDDDVLDEPASHHAELGHASSAPGLQGGWHPA